MARVVARVEGRWVVREDVPAVRKPNRAERRKIARRGAHDARTRKLIAEALKGSEP